MPYLILQLWCCGLTNYTDWQGTPWGHGHPDKLPYSCCQFTTEAVCSVHKETAAVHRMVRKLSYISQQGTNRVGKKFVDLETRIFKNFPTTTMKLF